MNMKKSCGLIFACLVLSILITSCNEDFYQVSTVYGEHTNSAQEFENEDIILKYNFWDEGGILSFTITNKTNEPIFIDWEHSNFIFNGYSYDYYSTETRISTLGVYSSKSVAGLYDSQHHSGTTLKTSKVSQEKTNAQIPPRSYIQAKVVNMDFPKLKLKGTKTFDKESSLLNVRSYLGYSKTKELDELTYIDNEFWVQEVTTLKRNEAPQKDKFYIKGERFSIIETSILLGIPATILILLIIR